MWILKTKGLILCSALGYIHAQLVHNQICQQLWSGDLVRTRTFTEPVQSKLTDSCGKRKCIKPLRNRLIREGGNLPENALLEFVQNVCRLMSFEADSLSPWVRLRCTCRSSSAITAGCSFSRCLLMFCVDTTPSLSKATCPIMTIKCLSLELACANPLKSRNCTIFSQEDRWVGDD